MIEKTYILGWSEIPAQQPERKDEPWVEEDREWVFTIWIPLALFAIPPLVVLLMAGP